MSLETILPPPCVKAHGRRERVTWKERTSMDNLYIVQLHTENDNGLDRIYLFEERENAIEGFNAKVREYTAAYGRELEDEKWELSGDGKDVCARSAWRLPDESMATVYLSDILPCDAR